MARLSHSPTLIFDRRPRGLMTIGIIGAMEAEIALHLARLQEPSQEVRAGLTFHRGRLAGQEVILLKCGVGKVNAAHTASLLVDRFAVSKVIFTGVAGALAKDLVQGDLVLGIETMQHDLDASVLGFAVGQVPYSAARVFPGDPGLAALAQRAATHLCLTVFPGRILSGDQFIHDSTKRDHLRDTLGGACVDMESAAVGPVCEAAGVPFLAIRAVSDSADEDGAADFTTFLEEAADTSARLVRTMLEGMG